MEGEDDKWRHGANDWIEESTEYPNRGYCHLVWIYSYYITEGRKVGNQKLENGHIIELEAIQKWYKKEDEGKQSSRKINKRLESSNKLNFHL